jgi:Ras-related C3 botulinum toxin substrate 1
MVGNTKIHLEVWDTLSGKEATKLRSEDYPETDVFIIYFSLVSPSSLESVANLWMPELKEHCPSTPCILVGTKLDLRGKGMDPVSTFQGDLVKKMIGSRVDDKCSAHIGDNRNQVFEEANKVVLHPSGPTPHCCAVA